MLDGMTDAKQADALRLLRSMVRSLRGGGADVGSGTS